MRKAILIISLGCLLLSAGTPSPETKAPDIIRIPLTRNDDIRLGIIMTFSFEKNEVDKALAETPVILPDPLPPGASIGINIPADLFVIMEKSEEGDAVFLTLDSNMNRDLRDDARIEVPGREIQKDGIVVGILRRYPGPDPIETRLPYRFTYNPTKNPAGEIEESILMSPAYRMEGTFLFQGHEYSIELDDFNMLGKFDKSNLSRGTVLRVSRKDDSQAEAPRLYGHELIPLGKEFYEVRDGALDGSWIELARNTLPHTLVGRPVPDFQLTDDGGETFRLSDYRGRYLLLDFWPSWCVPCIRQFPAIKKTLEFYADKPLSVVGINLDEENRLENVRKIISDYALPWRQILEGRGYFLPIYQILGRLPERRMSFPLYVAIDPQGIVRYATNDFRKMERFLESTFSDPPQNGEVLFIPMVAERSRKDAPPLPVDFDSESLSAVRRNPGLKLPAGLSPEVRIGRLPNNTLLTARPASVPGRILLRLDVNRNLDLAEEEEKDIPVLDRFPEHSGEAAEFYVVITLPGITRFFPVRFFALASREPDRPPEIYYIGSEEKSSGSFFLNGEEYEIHIADPTHDSLFTSEDTRASGFLTLKKRYDGGWHPVYSGISDIPIGGRLFRLRHVHEDGMLVELESGTSKILPDKKQQTAALWGILP